jgi:hypothetical protein
MMHPTAAGQAAAAVPFMGFHVRQVGLLLLLLLLLCLVLLLLLCVVVLLLLCLVLLLLLLLCLVLSLLLLLLSRGITSPTWSGSGSHSCICVLAGCCFGGLASAGMACPVPDQGGNAHGAPAGTCC